MAAIDELIAELERSYTETQTRLSDPSVYNDHREAADVGRRLKELEGPWKLAQEWRIARDDLEAARADPELHDLAAGSEADMLRLEEELKLALTERDPADKKDVIVEVRKGEGGDEGALWAADIYRMLTRYAERRGFTVEPLDANANDGGGFSKIEFAIKGDGAFSIFKFEGGTHRVQRVPETESQGRIHTSTATVAVMPEADEVDLEVDLNDLKIDVFRSSGPGGQSVNTTDSAVRITHVPRGSSSRCRTSARSCRTARRRCACCAHGSTRPSASARPPSRPPSARRRSAPASAPRRSAPTTTRRAVSRTTGSS